MRPWLAAAFAALALLPTACGKASHPAAPPAAVAPGPAYDTSAAANTKFLADYAAQKDIVKMPAGLLYRVIKSGSGKTPQSSDDLVTVTYKGQLINGTVFDETTKERGPATFPAGHLIPGWVEALSRMKEGDEWELVIPSALGYGEEGAGSVIPPSQTLVFRMTLLKVQSAR